MRVLIGIIALVLPYSCTEEPPVSVQEPVAVPDSLPSQEAAPVVLPDSTDFVPHDSIELALMDCMVYVPKLPQQAFFSGNCMEHFVLQQLVHDLQSGEREIYIYTDRTHSERLDPEDGRIWVKPQAQSMTKADLDFWLMKGFEVFDSDYSKSQNFEEYFEFQPPCEEALAAEMMVYEHPLEFGEQRPNGEVYIVIKGSVAAFDHQYLTSMLYYSNGNYILNLLWKFDSEGNFVEVFHGAFGRRQRGDWGAE